MYRFSVKREGGGEYVKTLLEAAGAVSDQDSCSRSSAETRPAGRDVLSVASLIEKTPEPPTEHGPLQFLGSQEAPTTPIGVAPTNVSNQGTQHAHLQCGENPPPEKQAAQQFTRHRQPPPPPPLPPGPLFLLLFTDTALLCQPCDITALISGARQKHSQQK